MTSKPEPVYEPGDESGGTQGSPPTPEGTWTTAELIAGIQKRITVPLEFDGKVKNAVFRPILGHEIAQINKNFANEDVLIRMAAIVSTCSVEPRLTFDEAKQMLPGHLQKCFAAIVDGSGYTETAQKN